MAYLHWENIILISDLKKSVIKKKEVFADWSIFIILANNSDEHIHVY